MKNFVKITNTALITSFILLGIAYSCNDPKKDPVPKTIPEVLTNDVFSITDAGAKVNVTITQTGGSTVTESGICWSRTNKTPTVADHKTADGKPDGAFVSTLSDLNPLDTYYVRAYAINSTGTAYGEAKLFKTERGTLTDNDGNVYHTITIGNQVWMQENLKTPLLSNGSVINKVEDGGTWGTSADAAFCWFDNNAANKDSYGALYNYYAVNHASKLSPNGWHVPSKADWEQLINYLGGSTVAGGKLKAITNWMAPNAGASNEVGFRALGGGQRQAVGTFEGMDTQGRFWSSTTGANNTAIFYMLSSADGKITEGTHDYRYGHSVRCIRDTPAKN